LWLLLVPGLSAGAAATPPAAPAASSTDVYKCSGPNNVPVYQESPCAPGRELRNFVTEPGTVSVIPFDSPESKPAASPARSGKAVKSPAPAKTVPAKGGDPAERRHLREGMTEAEVMARVGPPDMTSGKSGKVRWNYLPAAADPATITTVHFEHGKVVAVERKVMR
jgi:hypothetical protein